MRLFVFISVFALLSHSAFAQSSREPASIDIRTLHEDPSTSLTSERRALDEESEAPAHLTGDWGGLRTRLNEEGIALEALYRGETTRVFSGGIERKTICLGQLDLRLSIDAEKSFGWQGTSFFVYGLLDHGDDYGKPSSIVGDSQLTSNIETSTDTIKLYSIWAQQAFGYASLLAGVYDLNSEFYATESSSLLFNSSFGVGAELAATGLNGPSIFPTPAPALRLRIEPNSSWYAQIAIFNGQAGDPEQPRTTVHRLNTQQDGVLTTLEMGFASGVSDKTQRKAKYAVGAWGYSDEFETLLGEARAKNQGAYVLIDQAVNDSLSFFTRYGFASSAVNQIASNWSAGGVIKGILPGRADDRFSFGFTRALNGDEYLKAQESAGTPSDEAETTYELNYRIELYPGIALQPDYQYVVNPGTNPDTANTHVGVIRFEMAL